MGVFVAYSADSSCWCSHPDVIALKHKDGRVVFAPGLDRHCEQRVKGAGVQHGLQLQDVTDGDGVQLRLGKPTAINQYIKKRDLPLHRKTREQSWTAQPDTKRSPRWTPGLRDRLWLTLQTLCGFSPSLSLLSVDHPWRSPWFRCLWAWVWKPAPPAACSGPTRGPSPPAAAAAPCSPTCSSAVSRPAGRWRGAAAEQRDKRNNRENEPKGSGLWTRLQDIPPLCTGFCPWSGGSRRRTASFALWGQSRTQGRAWCIKSQWANVDLQ